MVHKSSARDSGKHQERLANKGGTGKGLHLQEVKGTRWGRAAVEVVQSMWCSLGGAIHVVRPTRCKSNARRR
eukprot:6821345-Pyramimonas_sp.AAC.1